MVPNWLVMPWTDMAMDGKLFVTETINGSFQGWNRK
jgi:hypothetical protein